MSQNLYLPWTELFIGSKRPLRAVFPPIFNKTTWVLPKGETKNVTYP